MCRQECAASCPWSQRNVFVVASCPHRTRADQCTPPFFCAFHALAVDDGGGRTGFPLLSFATLFIERVVDSSQRAVICPQIEVVVDRASRRQVFRDRAPLTAGRENVHETVHHLPHDHRALASASLARPDQWFDQSPIRRRSDRSDIATCCGRNGRGSGSSTSVTPPRIRPPPFNHSRFISFKNSSY